MWSSLLGPGRRLSDDGKRSETEMDVLLMGESSCKGSEFVGGVARREVDFQEKGSQGPGQRSGWLLGGRRGCLLASFWFPSGIIRFAWRHLVGHLVLCELPLPALGPTLGAHGVPRRV